MKKIKIIYNNKLWIVLTFVLNIILMIFLNPIILNVSYLHAEDGSVFINQFLKYGFGSYLITYGGYFNLLSRVFATISVTLSKIFGNAIVLAESQEILSIFFGSFVCAYFTSDTFSYLIKSRVKRILISLTFVLIMSNFYWLLYNGVGIHWWCGILSLLVSINLIYGKVPSYFILILTLISILSSPSTLIIGIALVFFFIKFFKIKNLKDIKKIKISKFFNKKNKPVIIEVSLIIIFLFIQSFAILFLGKVDAISSNSLTFMRLYSLIYYSCLLAITSINYLFGSDLYQSINLLGIGFFTGIILWLIVIYLACKHNKKGELAFIVISIIFLYFITLFKQNDFLDFYNTLISEINCRTWYQSIPVILVYFFTTLMMLNNFSDKKYILFQYSFIIIIACCFYKSSYHPDFTYTTDIEKISNNVDYSNDLYTNAIISPTTDWYVTLPVSDEYCEVNECVTEIP